MTTIEHDKEAIIAIVREMAQSMTGAQSTRHWAPDVLWFDIPPFASRGVAPAHKLFDDTFANFTSCKVDILELDAKVNGDMGIVCTKPRNHLPGRRRLQRTGSDSGYTRHDSNVIPPAHHGKHPHEKPPDRMTLRPGRQRYAAQ
jgi:ketosteroid isomerase-like protein